MRAIPIDRFLDTDEAGSSRPLEWTQLVAQGRAARSAADGGAWRIGDLALLVERRYRSGAIKRFADAIGESAGTVRRYRWVAGAYPAEVRARFPELAFCHFQAVAGMSDRIVWLERARRGSWSVARLTSYARDADAAPAPFETRARKPVDAATKQIAKLASLDRRTLSRAARAGLTEAVDELAVKVDELRARLHAIEKRSLNVAR